MAMAAAQCGVALPASLRIAVMMTSRILDVNGTRFFGKPQMLISRMSFRSPRACWIDGKKRSCMLGCEMELKRSYFSFFAPVTRRTPYGRRKFTTASVAQQEAEAPPQPVTMAPDTRIPVTVVTGFLGSGKTTLVNHVLTGQHGKRIAIIENEFGEVGIDGALVATQNTGSEDIIMLNNGCLCCTVRGDLVKMISELVTKKRDLFDHILIETTGLANPLPIIQTFYFEENIADKVKLDGVVTLVDAKHATMHIEEVKPDGVVNEAVQQIAYADRIILNKTDLVGESDLKTLSQKIKRINAMASMQHAQYGAVDIEYVLGVGGFDLNRIGTDVQPQDESKSAGHEHHEHDHKKSHDGDGHKQDKHAHHDHVHDPGVSSVSIVCEGDLDIEKVNNWLEGLLEVNGDDIYRMKGVLSIHNFAYRFVFQGVHALFEGVADKLWTAGDDRTNKLVFIGKNLDETKLRSGFQKCLVK